MRYILEAAATATYARLISARGLRRRVLGALRALLIRHAADPACRMMVHGRPLWMPLSHALPLYLRDFPLYDALPRRLGHFVRSRHGRIVVVDVGANVGDTIAAFAPADGDEFLAIEPSPKFARCLRRNFGSPAVEVVELAVSDRNAERGVAVVERAGTARCEPSVDPRVRIEVRKLDEVIGAHARFAKAHVLKIDTDGSDFAVLRSGMDFVTAARPMVLMEIDQGENEMYVEDFVETVHMLQRCGFSEFLVYDNFGYLMGCYSLSECRKFLDLIFYQLTSPFFYFDLLFLSDDQARGFRTAEHSFFVAREQGLGAGAARKACELIDQASGD